MKKMIAVILSVFMLFSVAGCSTKANGTISEVNNIDEETTVTFEEKPDNISDEIFIYGTNILDIVDQYLDDKVEIEEANNTIKELKEKISQNDKSGIYSLISLLDSSLETSDNIDELKKYRDYLARFLAKTLRYNETALPTFDITGDTFINQLNMILEETDPTLLLGNFEKKEISEGAIKEIYYLFTTDTGILVRYVVDKKTERLAGFTVSTDIQNSNENVFLDIGSYFVIANVALNLDTTIDDFEENLHLSDFKTKDYFMYNTEKANYSKSISDTQFSLNIYPN